jgi:tetratricopeptide (TPR) repeat protein
VAINKNKVMEAAQKFVEKGQTDKAIKEYLKVVQEDPKDVRVWLKIGDLYAKKGAKNEATETYLKVAKFYGEQGFYLKAVAVYKQILKLDPRLVEVNLKLAELYRQLGLMSDAMQHFEMVAAFFHREGKTREALATIRQLVDLDPENVATRIKLAELYSKEGMVEDAVAEFGHACDYLKKHKREDDYIKVAERLLWHKPERIELNRELATLYLRRGDPRRALQKLQACFKADPRHIETLGMLAQAFQALDQKGKTVSVLKEMARILMDAGKRRDAEEVHRKILAFVPNDPDSKAFLGDAASTSQSSAPRPATPVAPAVVEQVMEPAPRRTAAMAVPKNPTGSMPIVDPVALGLMDEDPEPDPAASSELQRRGFPQRGPAYRLASEGHDIETNALVAELELENEAFDQDSSVRGEAHADEIVKILTETDVYVKYGLHQKAIDHLRKVFDLDPHNLEARERLKDILVTQGRVAEAVQELLRMAEQMGPIEPDRAEIYLREMIRIAPDDGEHYWGSPPSHLSLFCSVCSYFVLILSLTKQETLPLRNLLCVWC